ncbi:hypothetical protein ABE096_22170 [Robertmurraya massiliosenegalensis]|uniref:hypothetical protein n=1 Tax=Robertmurraya TaxID=2837507 RepID=UPI0039A74088
MLMEEIIGIIRDDTISNKYDAILPHFYGYYKEPLVKILNHYGVRFDFTKKEWIIDEDKVDPSINVLHLIVFGEDLIPPKAEIKWNISRDFTSFDEILSILDAIQSHPDAKYKVYFGERMLKKVALYILEFLRHPMDGLLVNKDVLNGFAAGAITIEPYLADLIRTTTICLALKYNVRVPFKISSGAFNQFQNQSLLTSPQRDLILTNFSYTILQHLKDGNHLYEEVYETIINDKKYRNVVSKGGNIFYYVVMLLLENNKNRWNELNISDLNIMLFLHLREIGELDLRNISSINLLVYLKTGVNNFIPNIRYLDEILDANEVIQLFKCYRLYLKINKRSQSKFSNGRVVLNHIPSFIETVKDLTIENIIKWIRTYSDYALNLGTSKESFQDTTTSFLNILLDIKSFYEQENIFKLNKVFPYNGLDIGLKIRKYNFDETIIKESVYHQIKPLADMFDGNESIEKGTFKTNIEHADSVVRAIYDYKIVHEKGTIEYFNELQKVTMLRIIADAGVRSIEVLNMPFGTYSYLKEQGVNICILGWSKLFDRFGVVPISKSTARMIAECTTIRKEHFPETLNKMPIYQSNGSKGSSLEYIMQFISVHPNKKFAKRVGVKALEGQLDKVCQRAGISLIKGKMFHALRHRVAEYFFFCASYYDFEGKNDYEYKETIVKKLLRHTSSEMTKEYYWGELTSMIAEKKLVFYKDLSDISKYLDNPETKSEALIHVDSVQNKIRKDLSDVLSNPNVDKLIKLLTLPVDYFAKEILDDIVKNQDYKKIIEHLVKVDGNKSPVPVGSAYFGMCMNFSCPKLKEKITCVSCGDHIVTEKDVPRMIGEIVRCNMVIQSIYRKYDNTTQIDHLKSLRSRVVSNMERLQNELQIEPLKILELMQEHINQEIIL